MFITDFEHNLSPLLTEATVYAIKSTNQMVAELDELDDIIATLKPVAS